MVCQLQLYWRSSTPSIGETVCDWKPRTGVQYEGGRLGCPLAKF